MHTFGSLAAAIKFWPAFFLPCSQNMRSLQLTTWLHPLQESVPILLVEHVMISGKTIMSVLMNLCLSVFGRLHFSWDGYPSTKKKMYLAVVQSDYFSE